MLTHYCRISSLHERFPSLTLALINSLFCVGIAPQVGPYFFSYLIEKLTDSI